MTPAQEVNASIKCEMSCKAPDGRRVIRQNRVMLQSEIVYAKRTGDPSGALAQADKCAIVRNMWARVTK